MLLSICAFRVLQEWTRMPFKNLLQKRFPVDCFIIQTTAIVPLRPVHILTSRNFTLIKVLNICLVLLTRQTNYASSSFPKVFSNVPNLTSCFRQNHLLFSLNISGSEFLGSLTGKAASPTDPAFDYIFSKPWFMLSLCFF